jgi:Sigma-54, DNA binding domain.
VKKYSKSEKVYLKSIIGTLALEKQSDKEIQEYLINEKKIDVDRTTVTKYRRQIQASAYKWYNELRASKFLYIAHFKERIDTIYRVQKNLWDIVNNPEESTTERRGALSEIHHTEKTLSGLYDISRYLTDRIMKDYERNSTDNGENKGQGQQQSPRTSLPDAIPEIE